MTQSNFDPNSSPNNQQTPISPLLKLALEMGPLLIFFLTNYKGEWLLKNVPFFHSFDKPIFPATACFVVAIVIALMISWRLARRVPVMPLVSGVFVVVFGAMTLWLHDDTFIKIKPTIVNGLFAVLLFGGLLLKKPLLGYVFDSAFQLDREGWQKLTVRWACFFVFLGVVNEVVWRNFSDNFWTNFKVFGVMPISIIFFIAQMPLIMKHSTQPIGGNQDKPNK